MQRLTLNGAWQLRQTETNEAIPAQVPGCVHTDLLAAGKIDEPFYRDNELKLLWVGETDWSYQRRFFVSSEWLAFDRILLCCDGLDTIATVLLNGTKIAETDNMFRRWVFDVKPYLIEGENQIEITFVSAVCYAEHKDKQEPHLPAWMAGEQRLNSGGWIRKQPSSFGWDWGPRFATCGIWKDIYLLGFDTARLTDCHIQQTHHDDEVSVQIHAETELVQATPLTLKATIQYQDTVLDTQSTVVIDGQGDVTLIVSDPRLWYPNGMGDQPLHDVTVELLDSTGNVLDRQQERIGLRTLTLDCQADEWGESFQFIVNGKPFFAKGANWIPADAFIANVTTTDYRRLLEDCAAANFNMLRVWGGGIYEADVFYDICDELGLCVWQDFAFSCGAYPTFDKDFMDNVTLEAIDNIRRLRHHASLAIWCGNNELEQGLVGDTWTDKTMSWEDYKRLFVDKLAQLVQEHDPARPYWDSSAHTPGSQGRNQSSDEAGDAHLWQVWHGRKPFEWFRTSQHRFISEFGMQAFPHPDLVETYTVPDDRNLTSYVMEFHQRSHNGTSLISHYLTEWFQVPTRFDMQLWLTQIMQMEAIRYAVEHWRRNMPRTMGTLYWQLNDCWPGPSWSSIDYSGRWKALHYAARRFFASVLISGVEKASTGEVSIHVTCDHVSPAKGIVEWQLTDLEGHVIQSDAIDVMLAPNRDQTITTLVISEHLLQHTPRNCLLWLWLHMDGQLVAHNLVTFVRPKHMSLVDPKLRTSISQQTSTTYHVTIAAEAPALWVWLDLPGYSARYSDNFLHIMPGKPVQISLTVPDATLTTAALTETLQVYSLFETYQSF